jgi:transposase
MTHDYKRNGTTTLFAALNVLDGIIVGRNMKRHRHQEFMRFLNEVDAQGPKQKPIHAVVDNYATHKHPKVRPWLAQHPRWTFHFTPISASWLNAVQSFFAELTNRRLKRGVFRSSTTSRTPSIASSPRPTPNRNPSFWTARPNRILADVKRGKQTLESLH